MLHNTSNQVCYTIHINSSTWYFQNFTGRQNREKTRQPYLLWVLSSQLSFAVRLVTPFTSLSGRSRKRRGWGNLKEKEDFIMSHRKFQILYFLLELISLPSSGKIHEQKERTISKNCCLLYDSKYYYFYIMYIARMKNERERKLASTISLSLWLLFWGVIFPPSTHSAFE